MPPETQLTDFVDTNVTIEEDTETGRVEVAVDTGPV